MVVLIIGLFTTYRIPIATQNASQCCCERDIIYAENDFDDLHGKWANLEPLEYGYQTYPYLLAKYNKYWVNGCP